jgi:hypothetical protein
VILAGIAVAALDLHLHGFVVVGDPQGLLAAADIRNGGARKPLRRYAERYLVGRPTLEGTIHLTCRNGVAFEREYVTAGVRTRYQVTSEDCRPRARR